MTATMLGDTAAQTVSGAVRHERRRLLVRRISRNRLLVCGGGIFVLMVFAAVFTPVFLSHDPLSVDPADRLLAPGGAHVLGTDTFGRDLLARVVDGSRSSLVIGCSVAGFTGVFGLIAGLYAAFYPRLGAVLMRIADGLMAFPGILLAIAIMAALGPRASNVIIALTVAYTPYVARVVRSAALVVRNETYVEALTALGAGPTRILWLNAVPNVLSPLVVQITFILAEAMIAEAGLSFLGIGVPAPAPSWGNILYEGKTVIYNGWWMTVFPGLAILLTVLSVNLLGDGLRDLLDPRQAGGRS